MGIFLLKTGQKDLQKLTKKITDSRKRDFLVEYGEKR